MPAQAQNIENIHLAAEPVCQQHVTKTAHILNGEAPLHRNHEKAIFSTDQRAQFYSGEDRIMIPTSQLQRIYELEQENDLLQKEIFHKEHALNTIQDPLAHLADIEHAKMTIARNTGEILKIFEITTMRLERIAHLEKENLAMSQENHSYQDVWTTLHDMKERTNIASKIFLNKDLIARNEIELTMLKQEAFC